MSLQVTITVTGSDRTLQKMRRLGSSLYNFKDAMTEIGTQGKRYFAGTAWLSQGGVYGNKWAALTTPYAARKARKYPGRRMLVASGAMRAGFRMYADTNSVFIDNREPYFKYHQSSAARGSNLPRRQMIGASRGFRTIISTILRADIKRKVAGA